MICHNLAQFGMMHQNCNLVQITHVGEAIALCKESVASSWVDLIMVKVVANSAEDPWLEFQPGYFIILLLYFSYTLL